MIIFGTTIVFSYFFGREVIERKYPTILRTSGEANIPAVLNVTAETLPVLLGVANYDTVIPFTDDMAFSIVITTMKITREPDANGIMLP